MDRRDTRLGSLHVEPLAGMFMYRKPYGSPASCWGNTFPLRITLHDASCFCTQMIQSYGWLDFLEKYARTWECHRLVRKSLVARSILGWVTAEPCTGLCLKSSNRWHFFGGLEDKLNKFPVIGWHCKNLNTRRWKKNWKIYFYIIIFHVWPGPFRQNGSFFFF